MLAICVYLVSMTVLIKYAAVWMALLDQHVTRVKFIVSSHLSREEFLVSNFQTFKNLVVL